MLTTGKTDLNIALESLEQAKHVRTARLPTTTRRRSLSMDGAFGVPTPLEVRYHGEKVHHVITVNVINIAKHIEATKITSRLNLRIRLWYLASQPLSPPCFKIPLSIKPRTLRWNSGSLDNPGGKVALYMPRLSKRWQFSELHRFDDDVYATPSLINSCVFR